MVDRGWGEGHRFENMMCSLFVFRLFVILYVVLLACLQDICRKEWSVAEERIHSFHAFGNVHVWIMPPIACQYSRCTSAGAQRMRYALHPSAPTAYGLCNARGVMGGGRSRFTLQSTKHQ